jgi:hypothetical protein
MRLATTSKSPAKTKHPVSEHKSSRDVVHHKCYGLYKVALPSCILVLVLLVNWCRAETKRGPGSSSPNGYSNVNLGFTYAPPKEMKDETMSRREEIRTRAAVRHTSKTLDLLLSMSSGPDATASDWHLLSIETYPRQKFSDLDDISAEAKMSAWVAGVSGATEKPRVVVLAGQAFAVSVFGERDGTIKKGAVIWTTIRKNKLLSFSFVANSSEQLKRLTETMKSVQFF